jgi:hypothetical protein
MTYHHNPWYRKQNQVFLLFNFLKLQVTIENHDLCNSESIHVSEDEDHFVKVKILVSELKSHGFLFFFILFFLLVDI